MERLIKIGINDFRLVFRDNSLKIFLLLPLFILPVVRFGFPYVTEIYGFLLEYIRILLMFSMMQGSVAFGFIYSMVLVDEKDTNVAKVYGILPVSKFWFVVFRLIPPFLLATVSAFLTLLSQTFYDLSVISNLLCSALVGLIAPMMIMLIAIVANNKIEAMTWQKLFTIPLYLPIFAFFVPSSVSFLFSFLPSFWAYQSLDILFKSGNAFFYLLPGFASSFVILSLLAKRFIATHYQ